jgi:hypothetical protein
LLALFRIIKGLAIEFGKILWGYGPGLGMHRHKKLLENSQSFFVYCILYFESQNIFPKWVIFVVSYILVSLSDNFKYIRILAVTRIPS